MRVTFHGFDQARFLQPNGEARALTSLHAEVSANVPGQKSPWSYAFRLGLIAGGKLGGFDFVCESNGNACGDSAGFTRESLPEQVGAPSFFGAGPFLGRALTAGEHVDVELPGAGETRAGTWSMETAPAWRGHACLSASAPKRANVITNPLAPSWGSLRLCDGIPVPTAIALGNVSLDLQDYQFSGTQAFAEKVQRKAVENGKCSFFTPAEDALTLASKTYAAWARDQDVATQNWLMAHPDAKPLDGFGQRAYPDNAGPTKIVQTSTKTTAMILWMAKDGQMAAFDGDKIEETTLGKTTTTFVQSTQIASQPSIVAMEPRCASSSLDLGAVTSHAAFLARIDSSLNTTVVAPLSVASWFSAVREAAPFAYFVPGERDATFGPATAPWVILVWFNPDGQSVALPRITVVDAATGDIRWLQSRADADGLG